MPCRRAFLSTFRGYKIPSAVDYKGPQKTPADNVLQPGCLICRHAESEGVRFGEHVLAVKLFKDIFRRALTYAPVLAPSINVWWTV